MDENPLSASLSNCWCFPNARWYFKKFLKCFPLKVGCSCKPASYLSSEWLEQGLPQTCQRGSWSQEPQRGLGKPSLMATAFSLCVPGGEAGQYNRLAKRPVLCLMVYWYPSIRHHDLGVFLAPLYLRKTEDIRDKLGLEGERWDQTSLESCGSVLLSWKDSSCDWARQEVIVV